MRKVVALQLLTGVVFSVVLNLPVLLVRGGTGRAVAVGVVVLLVLGVAIGAARPRGGNRTVTITGSGMVTGTLLPSSRPFDAAAVMARLHRRRRLANLQLPALAGALVAGSVVGAVSGPWWAEVLGGAVGFGLAVVVLFLLLFPREAWTR